MKNIDLTIEKHVILFTDIHDYSIMVHQLGEHQHGDFLQEIYETLGDVIVKYHGEILKYIGDALLCVFPADSENEVIQCALELRQAFAGIITRRAISHETELEIGISSGTVEVGTIGHPSLRQKDIFGEEVSRAAVIGHHRGIAITETVYRKIHKKYPTVQLPPFKAKWLDEPLKVWEIQESL